MELAKTLEWTGEELALVALVRLHMVNHRGHCSPAVLLAIDAQRVFGQVLLTNATPAAVCVPLAPCFTGSLRAMRWGIASAWPVCGRKGRHDYNGSLTSRFARASKLQFCCCKYGNFPPGTLS